VINLENRGPTWCDHIVRLKEEKSPEEKEEEEEEEEEKEEEAEGTDNCGNGKAAKGLTSRSRRGKASIGYDIVVRTGPICQLDINLVKVNVSL
jgi:CO dehydrogenase/acetyl-CoA synthase beta subunit